MKSVFFRVFILLLIIPQGAFIANAAESVSIQLPWHHQFQFAGYYMAKEKGFYKNVGLEVDIRDVTQGSDTVDEVVSGQATFGVNGSGLLVERSQGKPVVVLAAIFQQSPTVFITSEQSGIREPADFVNKRVMLSPGFTSLSLIAFLHQEHVLDKIVRLDTSFDYHSLMNGQTDVFNAYVTNEPSLLTSQGYKHNIINPEDYGIHFYGDTLFTSEQTIKNRPKAVEKFRKASIEGWEYALDHPDETIRIIKTKYQVDKTTEQLQLEAAEVTRMIQPESLPIGTSGLSRWTQISHHLIAIGAVPATFHLEQDFLYIPPEKIDWKELSPWIIGVAVAFFILTAFLAVLARTNRKLFAAQKKLSASENKYKTVINKQRDILLLDKAVSGSFSPFIQVNDAAVKFYGYTHDELLRLSLKDLIAAERLEEHLNAGDQEELLEQGNLLRQSIHINKSGEHVPVEISATAIEIEGEKYILTMVHDLRHRIEAEAKLYESHAMLKAAMDCSPAGIAIANAPDGNLRYVNDAGLHIRGGNRDDITKGIDVNQYVAKWQLLDLDGQPLETDEVPLVRAIIYGEENSRDFIIRDAEGNDHTVSAKAAPIKDKDGRTIAAIVVFHDISDRKKAEQDRLELESQLNQKHKMEAVGFMAGGMAHNFNNNLSIILGNVELSQMKQPSGSEVIPLLENAKIAVRRSRDLVQKIITYSRQGIQQKAPMQLTTIIDETISLLRSTLPATVALQKIYSPDCDTELINADASQIQEVLINLCNNAIQAMQEKGELKIQLEPVELTQPDIPAQYDCLPGPYAKLSFQDSGCGMPAEMLDKIFDPFYTTKEAHEGAGMGLATVQGIVAQHGGFIKVNSIPDQGTVFNLYFTIIEQTHIDEPTAEDTTLPRGTERILFVDDDEMLASLGAKLLTEMGYQVSIMTDSTEALKMFTANADRFDFVITDQTMPNLTGKELIEEVKKVRPDMPTILCTGYSSKIDEEEAKELGISAFLMKPLDLHTLAKTIRRVLDGES